ncbi:MAG: phycobiliprotein lyase [Leptolyngbya sp. SIO4C1]|nr:phycobiliprotein lyase [Leptolyngbya sp. SIO4C1]
MEIVNFFEKLAGRWFSQRTTHDLSAQQSKAGQSNLEATFLAATAPPVQQLCEQLGVDASLALCGLEITQTSTVDGNPQQRTGSALVVPLTPESDTAGELLRSGTGVAPAKSRYSWEAEIFTVSSEADDIRSEERWWFITDNLRMRTNILKRPDGFHLASFCSEIRLGVKRPPADAA